MNFLLFYFLKTPPYLRTQALLQKKKTICNYKLAPQVEQLQI